jgi:tetratricopeptide (TPR) repeat protein
MGIVVAMGVVLTSSNAWAKTVVPDIKTAFDAAMAKPLNERIALLESVEQQIDGVLFTAGLAGEPKAAALFYKFHAQRQLAKYPQAYQTYANYVRSIRSFSIGRARSVFSRDAAQLEKQRNFAQCAAMCEAIGEEFTDDSDLTATALYYLAWSKYWMNGTVHQSVDVCNELIANHVDSPWRPKAMRLLANAKFALGDYDGALSTLSLLKQHYPNTEFEQYADMRPAMIYEIRGELPYQQTLKRHSSHMYAAYIHRQIKRLQKTIEEQLIHEALDGLEHVEVMECKTKSIVVKSEPATSTPMAARF